MLHNEGLTTRNYTSYNFQVLRDDVYMLGVDGTVTGHRIAPVRSSCAVVVSSQNANREWLYNTQQTVSAEGFSGQAFSHFVPHTVRAQGNQACTDCHVSDSATITTPGWRMLLLQGTNFLNFMGRYVYVADGSEGIRSRRRRRARRAAASSAAISSTSPIPTISGSTSSARTRTQQSVSPRRKRARSATARRISVCGAGCREASASFDVANIDNKGFSERMVTAPVSPLGQRFYVKTKYATAVASPSTQASGSAAHAKCRKRRTENSPDLRFLYVADKYEGLVVVGDPDLKEKKPGRGHAARWKSAE